MKDKLMHLLMGAGRFSLRGAGWVTIGVLVGFVSSYFYRLPGRVDTFALTETLLGVVITGLSIVGAFMVALQWSNLESKIHAFDVKVKETNESFEKANEEAIRVAKNIDAYVETTVKDYKEKVDYVEKLLDGNERIANEINRKIDEYKVIYVDNEEKFYKKQKILEEEEREFYKKQKELESIIKDYKTVIEKTLDLQKSSNGK